MRLGAKFVLLVAGSVLTPVAVATLSVLAVLGDDAGRGGALSTLRIKAELGDLAREGATLEAAIKRLGAAAAKVGGSVAMACDDQGRAVFSSSDKARSVGDLLGLGCGARSFSFTVCSIAAPDGARYSLLFGFPAVSRFRGSRSGLFLALVAGSTLAFMTLMSLIIVGSINASIARLEEATRRISAGDLDFRISVRGDDKLARLGKSFEAMRGRVEEEASRRARFIMGISHDLKTPLSSITGYVDALRDGMASDPAQRAKYLAIIRDKAGLLEGRISQLIDFVKLETSEWRGHRENLPLGPFLEEAFVVFASEAEARGFRLEASIGLDPGACLAMDADLVFRAIENLVQNAFRYAENGSAIRIEARQEPGRIVLGVHDRGEGIAEMDMPFIFEPFYRGSGARRETGFGLGLSVVKSVVASHGWRIACVSRNGETSFLIEIPFSPNIDSNA